MSEPAAETTELPIGCPNCGGLLTALVGPPEPEAPPVAWTCPFCRREHTTDFGGAVIWIAKREVIEPDRPH